MNRYWRLLLAAVVAAALAVSGELGWFVATSLGDGARAQAGETQALSALRAEEHKVDVLSGEIAQLAAAQSAAERASIIDTFSRGAVAATPQPAPPREGSAPGGARSRATPTSAPRPTPTTTPTTSTTAPGRPAPHPPPPPPPRCPLPTVLGICP